MSNPASIYFLACFSIVYGISSILGSSMTIPKRMNDVYYWEKQLPHHSTAKYEDGKHLNVARNSSRRLFGRHICTQSKVVMLPVKDMQSYCKPNYQSYLRRCDKDSSKLCTGYRVVYEMAYRMVQRLIPKTESTFACCPGWSHSHASSPDCKKAVCQEDCKNGGVCIKPDHCSCPPGWTGKTCETDIDECMRKTNPCHQECINLPGSYRCACKDGYTLQPDRRSCLKDIQTNEIQDNGELMKKIEVLQKRLEAMEDWQRRLTEEQGQDSRHPRDDRINSLSDQIAILEEKLDDCTCNRRDIPFPRPQR